MSRRAAQPQRGAIDNAHIPGGGASGVVGRVLAPLLADAGHRVTGTTRSEASRDKLLMLGLDAVVVDVFDSGALTRAVKDASPDVVIHQLTSLAGGSPPAGREAVLRDNARLRREGTANLVKAALAAGARRLVAQSIAWAYAPKTPPYRETDPLDLAADGVRAITVRDGVAPLEAAVLSQAGLDGIVLRYGQFYGPGTWNSEPTGASCVHVEAAAYAAFLAVGRGSPGVYNVAEPGGEVSVEKARTELGWRHEFRIRRSPPGG